jgi:cytochrome d ubiquinol oxidase subunit I
MRQLAFSVLATFNFSILSGTPPLIPQGPLLGYESFTAFMLEATFFGVMLLGRERV